MNDKSTPMTAYALSDSDLFHIKAENFHELAAKIRVVINNDSERLSTVYDMKVALANHYDTDPADIIILHGLSEDNFASVRHAADNVRKLQSLLKSAQDTRDEMILELHEQGNSPYYIADIVGFSRQAVIKCIERAVAHRGN